MVLHTRYRLFQIGDEFLWNMTEAVQGPRALWRKHTGQRIATWMFYVRTSFSVVFCLLLDGFVIYTFTLDNAMCFAINMIWSNFNVAYRTLKI